MPPTYTPATANAALPYVRRIVADLVRDHADWRASVAALAATDAALEAGRAPTPPSGYPGAYPSGGYVYPGAYASPAPSTASSRSGTPTAPHAGPVPDMPALRRRAAQLADDVRGALADLAALGVECKGLDVGLIDFPTVIDGAPAYLCWRLGEPTVAWWHRRDAGFSGRRLLAGTYAAEAAQTAAARAAGTASPASAAPLANSAPLGVTPSDVTPSDATPIDAAPPPTAASPTGAPPTGAPRAAAPEATASDAAPGVTA